MYPGLSTEHVNAFDDEESSTLCLVCHAMVVSGNVHAFIECGIIRLVFMWCVYR